MCMVSVIMSTYTEELTHLQKAIESILNQTYSDFEFIIVIDNPNNASLKECIYEYKRSDPRIVIIENENNIGLANSLNRAIAVAKGYYIARMDADDIAFDSRIDSQIKYMEENKLDLVGAKKQDIGNDGDIISNDNNEDIPYQIIPDLLKIYDCIPHPTWLVKKEIYNLLQGYRDLPRAQDYDFLLRARSRKIKMGICNETLLQYRINPKGISKKQALEQKLTAKYLSNNYRRINKISVKKLNKYVESKAKGDARNKYAEAMELYIEARRIYKYDIIKSIVLILGACKKSKWVTHNLLISIKRKIKLVYIDKVL